MTDAKAVQIEVGARKELDKLIKQIDEKLADKDLQKRPEVAAATCKKLFGELATMRNVAETAGTESIWPLVDAERIKLKLSKKAQTPADKVSMYVRLVLTAVLAIWGALCLCVLTPLRILHPMLRQAGVPNGSLPLDLLIEWWSRGVLAAAGVKVTVEAGNTVNWISQPDLVGIMVYNHGSNLDPFVINASCRNAPKYIGKKVLFMIPIVGWLFILCGMVPLNRGDREKAVNTMNKVVAHIMTVLRRSVAISPEGTRTTDGHLRLPFKKGVFHLQEQTKVPILPVVIHGTYELWPPGRLFTSPGEVFVSFMPPKKVEEATDKMNARDATRLSLQQGYVDALAECASRGTGELSLPDVVICLYRIMITLLSYLVIWRSVGYVTDALGFGTTSYVFFFLAASGGAAVYVEKFM